jgi:hypothetical protein
VAMAYFKISHNLVREPEDYHEYSQTWQPACRTTTQHTYIHTHTHTHAVCLCLSQTYTQRMLSISLQASTSVWQTDLTTEPVWVLTVPAECLKVSYGVEMPERECQFWFMPK